MKISYMLNSVSITKSLAEWYIGAYALERLTDATIRSFERSGRKKNKMWLEGTGFLTVILE